MNRIVATSEPDQRDGLRPLAKKWWRHPGAQAALKRGIWRPRNPQLEPEVQTQQVGDVLQVNSDTDA